MRFFLPFFLLLFLFLGFKPANSAIPKNLPTESEYASEQIIDLSDDQTDPLPIDRHFYKLPLFTVRENEGQRSLFASIKEQSCSNAFHNFSSNYQIKPVSRFSRQHFPAVKTSDSPQCYLQVFRI